MAIRKPVVSGTFYESEYPKLLEQLQSCFSHPKGPGELPTKRGTKVVRAIIAPHAGYVYSGPCAAWSYKEIAESELPDTYIIIGPNHTGEGKSSFTLDDWETPLGIVHADKMLGKQLARGSGLIEDNAAHRGEHSIEVQLPFLQFAARDQIQRLQILPITLSDDIPVQQLALDLKEVIMDMDRKVVFIISSDFTHYGHNYHYLPFTLDVQKQLYDMDGTAIKLIRTLDSAGFKQHLHDTQSTICGQAPLQLLMRILGKGQGELLQYYTSADITESSYRNTVGYASIIFR